MADCGFVSVDLLDFLCIRDYTCDTCMYLSDDVLGTWIIQPWNDLPIGCCGVISVDLCESVVSSDVGQSVKWEMNGTDIRSRLSDGDLPLKINRRSNAKPIH